MDMTVFRELFTQNMYLLKTLYYTPFGILKDALEISFKTFFQINNKISFKTLLLNFCLFGFKFCFLMEPVNVFGDGLHLSCQEGELCSQLFPSYMLLIKQFFLFFLSFVRLLFNPVEFGSQGFNFFGFLDFFLSLLWPQPILRFHTFLVSVIKLMIMLLSVYYFLFI